MSAPVYAVHQAKKILLAADTEEALRIETQTLTAVGVSSFVYSDSIRGVTSILQGETAKRQFGVDALVCAETLEGGSIYLLLQKMATDASLSRFPLLLVTATPDSAVLARKNGLVAIARPYTRDRFAEALSLALSVERSPLSEASMNAVCSRLTKRKQVPLPHKAASVKTNSDILEEAVHCLKNGELRKAEDMFLSAAKRSYDNAQAFIGLARVKARQGDKRQTAVCLIRAAAAFKRQKQLDRAKAVCAMLPAGSQVENIFLHEAAVCLQAGNYTEAAMSILEHLYEHTEARLHLIVGRLCQLTSSPDESIGKLCEAYARLGYTSIAQRLYAQLAAELTALDYCKPRWLDRHPRLREVVEVAGYTASIWRQARV